MTSLELLPVILTFQIGVITILVVMLFGLAGKRVAFDRRHAAGLLEARQAIARMLQAGSYDLEAEARFGAIPRSLQIRLVWELAPKLVGDSRTLLADLAQRTGLLRWAELGCESPRWHQRLHGIRLLTLLRVYRDAARPLLDDSHPLVRAQALEWAGDHPSVETIRKLIDHFDDPSHLCLFATQDALLRVGNPAIPQLVEYLGSDRVRSPSEALEVACGLADPRFLPIALKLSSHRDDGVRSKAAGLLSGIGGDLAVSRLLEMVDDESGRVRASVAQGLGEMGHWPAAAAVASLLRDSDFSVRREAGLALQKLGSPGELMLRRFRGDGDRYAADMAMQVLDLPRIEAPERR